MAYLRGSKWKSGPLRKAPPWLKVLRTLNTAEDNGPVVRKLISHKGTDTREAHTLDFSPARKKIQEWETPFARDQEWSTTCRGGGLDAI